MDRYLQQIKAQVYDRLNFKISSFEIESESKAYHACRFKLNKVQVVCRTAKQTPKKLGQFVTFWKRVVRGPIEPFHEKDLFDFFIVNVETKEKLGQFVFPKAVLVEKGILSRNSKEGKRGFRVYPPYGDVQSNQAGRTQKWQSNFFFEVAFPTNLDLVKDLYSNC